MFGYKHARLRQLPTLPVFTEHACAFRADKKLPPIRLDTIRRIHRQVNALLSTTTSAEDAEVIDRLLEPYGWVWFPTDWYLVAMDETGYWNLAALGDDAQWVTRIEDVCLFDRRTKVHICSTTPSYEVWHVAHQAVFRPDTPDAVRKRVAEFVSGAYAEPVGYMDCIVLDRVIARDGARRHVGEWPSTTAKVKEYLTAGGELDTKKIVDEIVARLCEEGEV